MANLANLAVMFEDGVSNAITYFTVTESLVQPLVNSINSALTTMVPIGIGVMSSFIGVNILKRIIYSFL